MACCKSCLVVSEMNSMFNIKHTVLQPLGGETCCMLKPSSAMLALVSIQKPQSSTGTCSIIQKLSRTFGSTLASHVDYGLWKFVAAL